MNDVIVNLDKFQAMIMSCDKKRQIWFKDKYFNNHIIYRFCYTFRYWYRQQIKLWKACFNYYFLLYIYSIVYIFVYCKFVMFWNICFFIREERNLFILLLYKSCTVFIRFSSSFFEVTYMLLQKNCINNGVKKHANNFIW